MFILPNLDILYIVLTLCYCYSSTVWTSCNDVVYVVHSDVTLMLVNVALHATRFIHSEMYLTQQSSCVLRLFHATEEIKNFGHFALTREASTKVVAKWHRRVVAKATSGKITHCSTPEGQLVTTETQTDPNPNLQVWTMKEWRARMSVLRKWLLNAARWWHNVCAICWRLGCWKTDCLLAKSCWVHCTLCYELTARCCSHWAATLTTRVSSTLSLGEQRCSCCSSAQSWLR